MTNFMDTFEFYEFVLLGTHWPPAHARIATAVALSGTGIDLDFSGGGLCTAFAFPSNVVDAFGVNHKGPFSEKQTSNIGMGLTYGGKDWRLAESAYKNPNTLDDSKALNGVQKGSPAAQMLPEVDRAIKNGSSATVGYGAGLGHVNKGWATFQNFIGTWSRGAYSEFQSSAAAIRRATQ